MANPDREATLEWASQYENLDYTAALTAIVAAEAKAEERAQFKAWIEEERGQFAQLYPACGRMLDRLRARVEKP